MFLQQLHLLIFYEASILLPLSQVIFLFCLFKLMCLIVLTGFTSSSVTLLYNY